MLTRHDLDALGADLMAADDAADPQKLANIAWQLYGEAGIDQADIDRLHAALRLRSGAAGIPPATSASPAPRLMIILRALMMSSYRWVARVVHRLPSRGNGAGRRWP